MVGFQPLNHKKQNVKCFPTTMKRRRPAPPKFSHFGGAKEQVVGNSRGFTSPNRLPMCHSRDFCHGGFRITIVHGSEKGVCVCQFKVGAFPLWCCETDTPTKVQPQKPIEPWPRKKKGETKKTQTSALTPERLLPGQGGPMQHRCIGCQGLDRPRRRRQPKGPPGVGRTVGPCGDQHLVLKWSTQNHVKN